MKRHIHYPIGVALAAALGIAGCGSFAYAQTSPQDTADQQGIIIVIGQEVAKDEDVTARDLGVAEPRILPTNPLYVFKDLGRGVRTALAFNPVRKAELKLQFANERLIETKKVAERTKDPDVLKPVLESYRQEVARVKERAENITGQADGRINQFLDKLTDQQLKHQKFLGKLEKEIPAEAFGALEQAKGQIAETMAAAPLAFESPEQFQERLTKVMDGQSGSDFKHFKNLEVLKALEEKVPKEARAAIRHAQENAKKRFEETFQQLDEQKRQTFGEYVKQIGGNEVRHAAVIQDLALADVSEEIRDVFAGAKEETFKRVEGRLKQFTDEAQKGEFLKHLENAKVEDLRIVKELEKNLPPDAIGKVLEVKAKAMAKFKDDFESADTPSRREGFFKEMERFHDAKMTDIFQEMASVIPEDKKEFFGQMKQKAAEEMKKEIDRAGLAGRAAVLQKLAGDHPAEIEAFGKFQREFQRFGPPEAVFEEIKRQHTGNVSGRLERFQDTGQIEQFRQAIEQNDAVRREFQQFAPNVFRQAADRAAELGANADPSQARQKIEEARRALDNAEQFGAQIEGAAANDQRSHNVLLQNAREKLQRAEEALETGKTGEAFGQANAAFHNASNATNFLKNVSIQKDIKENRPPEFLPPEAQQKFFQEFERKPGSQRPPAIEDPARRTEKPSELRDEERLMPPGAAGEKMMPEENMRKIEEQKVDRPTSGNQPNQSGQPQEFKPVTPNVRETQQQQPGFRPGTAPGTGGEQKPGGQAPGFAPGPGAGGGSADPSGGQPGPAPFQNAGTKPPPPR